MPIEPDNVVLNKAAIIERSLNRMREEYRFDPELQNYTHIDAMILNIERACQASIDLAQHIVAENHLGMPQTSADAFILLKKANLVSEKTARAMVSMTGFRNVAIHEYQELELEILHTVAKKEYKSLILFCREAGVDIEVSE